jgi:hypothetical protein
MKGLSFLTSDLRDEIDLYDNDQTDVVSSVIADEDGEELSK